MSITLLFMMLLSHHKAGGKKITAAVCGVCACVCVSTCAALPDRVCARRAAGSVVCVFIFVYVSLPFFFPSFFPRSPGRPAHGSREKGEKESVLNFLLKRKFICSC